MGPDLTGGGLMGSPVLGSCACRGRKWNLPKSIGRKVAHDKRELTFSPGRRKGLAGTDQSIPKSNFLRVGEFERVNRRTASELDLMGFEQQADGEKNRRRVRRVPEEVPEDGSDAVYICGAGSQLIQRRATLTRAKCTRERRSRQARATKRGS